MAVTDTIAKIKRGIACWEEGVLSHREVLNVILNQLTPYMSELKQGEHDERKANESQH